MSVIRLLPASLLVTVFSRLFPVVSEIRLGEMVPVFLQQVLGFPAVVNVDVEVLVVRPNFSVVAVDVDVTLLVFGVVDFGNLNTGAISEFKKEDDCERLDVGSTGGVPSADMKNCVSDSSLLVYVRKFRGHIYHRKRAREHSLLIA